MEHCKNCGAQLSEENQVFCTKCGYKLDDSQPIHDEHIEDVQIHPQTANNKALKKPSKRTLLTTSAIVVILILALVLIVFQPPRIVNGTFNSNDARIVKWINRIDETINVSTTPTDSTSEGKLSVFKYSVQFYDEVGTLYFFRSIGDNKLRAVAIEFDDANYSAELGIQLAQKIDSDFSRVDAMYKYDESDIYCSTKLSAVPIKSDDLYVLVPTEFALLFYGFLKR